MKVSGASRMGALLSPNASDLMPMRIGKPLAKVLGLVIQGDASAKRRSPIIDRPLIDRETGTARKTANNILESWHLWAEPSRSTRGSSWIAGNVSSLPSAAGLMSRSTRGSSWIAGPAWITLITARGSSRSTRGSSWIAGSGPLFVEVMRPTSRSTRGSSWIAGRWYSEAHARRLQGRDRREVRRGSQDDEDRSRSGRTRHVAINARLVVDRRKYLAEHGDLVIGVALDERLVVDCRSTRALSDVERRVSRSTRGMSVTAGAPGWRVVIEDRDVENRRPCF